ncbi:hypothetical protein [Tropicibacter sp. S64]|uniref:hypothetical protein n=1 Tax=Tropicibacter sp. S64 TaxID=3415122 RepID=UPI003C7D0625
MTTRADITYKPGSALEIEATLTWDGSPVTSGTVMLYVSSRPGLSAEISAALTHGSGGVWSATVPAATMEALERGMGWYEIWDTDSDRAFLEGEVAVGLSLRP